MDLLTLAFLKTKHPIKVYDFSQEERDHFNFMNHSTHVLGSGNNKINISQSVVWLEFNRKMTIMKGYPQVNKVQIPLKKRGKK